MANDDGDDDDDNDEEEVLQLYIHTRTISYIPKSVQFPSSTSR